MSCNELFVFDDNINWRETLEFFPLLCSFFSTTFFWFQKKKMNFEPKFDGFSIEFSNEITKEN